MKVNGIILAAGLSSRMKAFKPLLKLKEKTIIEHSIDSMFNAGVSQVIVVLGYRAEEVEAFLSGKYNSSRLIFIQNRRYSETDMLTSIKIGISVLNTCDAFYILPGDMPAIHISTFTVLKEAMCRTDAMVAFPTIDGKRKHPPLISWNCIDFILNFNGEGGLREVWKQFEGLMVTAPVEDFGCMLDADTKLDYDRLLHYMDREIYLKQLTYI
ncbi:nucleotidyltransferase family protein [Clostridium sp. PL3]|uniref:Nucleotidyltransferase family protein n=1 Tax=Clostridium thailandense TaxID=2794346 RepID=A0A949TUN5_9CLOT|nr:nucleotidyltransferase family protein [Clostridium thailandense]MBV7271735.1 nucleotidyltransferase family protein [Clostridium thailandense]